MRLKIIFVFLITIFIPTTLLVYFGLLAVRSEKVIVENTLKQRYKAIVDIVVEEIKEGLNEAPPEVFNNSEMLEEILIKQASIFKRETAIFDKNDNLIGRELTDISSPPVLKQQIIGLPYTIAVYDYHVPFLKSLEKGKRGIYFYVTVIIFSAFFILCGSFFALWALSREWRLAKLKSEFISHLSHDLRRPLTSIHMFSEMLKNNRVQGEEKKEGYYTIIANESERLIQLADGVLDFSRIEKGHRKYNFKQEDILKLTKEVITHFKSYMGKDADRIELFMDTAEVLPLVKIDAVSISQAVTNLLTNAVKFSTLDKKIIVNLKKEKRNVILEVIDEGIGIPKSEQKKIFSKFYRGRSKEVKDKEGAGYGLTLVKYVVEANKGKVRLKSKEGQGSKFSLIFPNATYKVIPQMLR